MYDSRFDDIRPYHEEEIPDAMKRIAASEYFPLLSEYLYPGEDVSQIREMVSRIDSIWEFQTVIMKMFNEQVISRSTSGFAAEGLENLEPVKSYLFVSNHRDIVLDSALLQYALYCNGFETTDITFGSNLMSGQLIIDIGKSNKMFRVERASNSREFISQSRHLSDFIYEDITKLNKSVWIAQRNGRTKNGIDATDPGIIKMFCMSPLEQTGRSCAEILDDLRIVPVAVSYEWEPCDILKAVELVRSRNGKYQKQPGEDLDSILSGILEFKGKVHFKVCKPLVLNGLSYLDSLPNNQLYREVAAIIDRNIIGAFKLMPNNYIAHDLRAGVSDYQNINYSDDDRDKFIKRLQKIESDDLRSVFLDIYANPVDSKLSLQNSK